MSRFSDISSSSAHLLALGFALCYVGSLYVSNHTRLSFSKDVKVENDQHPRAKLANERWRDDPEVIKARLLVVSIASTICCITVFFLLWHLTGSKSLYEAALLTGQHLGWNLGSSVLPHLVTPVLFFGPLFAMYLGRDLPLQRAWSLQEQRYRFISWTGVRTYFMGPFTEELVFRACVLSVYYLSGSSKTKMIFLTPLTFGVAHVHHAWDIYNRYGRTKAAARRAILSSLFQLLYTTLFGFHAAYIFLRTGSLFPAFTAHAFCNIMGFPDIQYELKRFPRHRMAIQVAYVIGIIGFIYTLPRWTLSRDSVFWP